MKKTKGKKRKVLDNDDDNSNDSFEVASNASITENMQEVGGRNQPPTDNASLSDM